MSPFFFDDRIIPVCGAGLIKLKVELFIVPGFTRPLPSVPHFCLQIPGLPGFLEKARSEGVRVISAERGERTVYFVEDFS